MVESPDDFAAFMNPDEFGVFASCEGQRFAVIFDTFHDQQRPGGTSNSTMGSFMVGAADVSLTVYQATTGWPLAPGVAVEKTLTIESGPDAGNYRIKDIERDGAMVRLMLNKRP